MTIVRTLFLYLNSEAHGALLSFSLAVARLISTQRSVWFALNIFNTIGIGEWAMKKIMIFLAWSFLFSSPLHADQLAWLKQQDAERAASLLRGESELVLFCGCCDSDVPVYLQLFDAQAQHTGTESYWEVQINAVDYLDQSRVETIDLAYVWIRRDNQAINLGRALDLPCDPCQQAFLWDSPWEQHEYSDEAVELTARLIYNHGESRGMYAYLLRFVAENDATEEYYFDVDFEFFSALPFQLIEDLHSYTSGPAQAMLGRLFEVTYIKRYEYMEGAPHPIYELRALKPLQQKRSGRR